MSNISFLSPNQLKRAINVLWQANIPAAIFGGPGCGKTTAVQELVKEVNAQNPKVNLKLWPMILSYKAPEDIGGIPYPNKEHTRVRYLLPEDLPFNTEEGGIIFGDEFDRATPETQNAFLQILLGKEIHGARLSPNAYVILAMNGVSDIYTTQLSLATITRVCTLFVASTTPAFLDSFDEWADVNDVLPTVTGFLKFNPSLLSKFEDFDELAKPNPRSLLMAGEILKVINSVKFPTEDIVIPLLEGVLGRAVAIQLLEYFRLCKELPTAEEILRNPDKVKLPTRPDVLYTLKLSVLGYMKTGCKKLGLTEHKLSDILCRFAARLPDEIAASMFRKLMDKLPIVATDKRYIKWAAEHKVLLSTD